MHIPDGYLSPQTYVPAYGIMLSVWAWASKQLDKTLRARQVPTLALGAAFCFVIMMFNIPIPGGTTGHAVGGVLVAILLGPWAAMMAVSLALIVQALVFGDGGVTAIGANCLNMAVVMPFAGWAAYRLVAGSSSAESPRRRIGAAIGGYVGLNAAALSAGVMFGIQPLIAHNAQGQALYCPFGLKVAVPAMMAGHLLVFGIVEAVVTGLVVAYIQRTDPSLIPAPGDAAQPKRRLTPARVALAFGVLLVLTPLGLYLPARFAAGSAWGEWSADEVAKITGCMPAGLSRLGDLWHAPMSDYALPGKEQGSSASLVYVVSALVGLAAIALGALVLRMYLLRKDRHEYAPDVDAASADR